MTLRPDTGDGRSLPCVTCGISTPDASYCCGLPCCDNCIRTHVCDDDPEDQPTMCLLHGDFHYMDSECWSVTLDWHLAHRDLSRGDARNLYQIAVERKMLDNLRNQSL